jgi:hypothetical protein
MASCFPWCITCRDPANNSARFLVIGSACHSWKIS